MTTHPTNQVRWLVREIPWSGGPISLGGMRMTHRVLQQLWVPSPPAFPGQVVAGGEWRDVPTVDET